MIKIGEKYKPRYKQNFDEFKINSIEPERILEMVSWRNPLNVVVETTKNGEFNEIMKYNLIRFESLIKSGFFNKI